MRYRRQICLFFTFLTAVILNTGIPPAYAAAPVISEIGSQTTKEDTAITVGFTINADSNLFPFPLPSDDPDEDTPVTVTAVSDNRILIPNDNIVHSSSEKNHTLTITPAANQYGTATITVTANADSYSSMKSFQLTVTSVNDAPAATVPNARTMEEDKIFVFGVGAENTITVADIDAGENRVEATVSAGHGILKAGTGTDADITGFGTSSLKLTGTVAQISNWFNGMIYTPASNWHGTDTITLSINDKGHSGENQGSSGFPFPGMGTTLSDTKTISFTVTPVNDPLSLGFPAGVQIIDEDMDLLFSTAQGNGVSVTDPDGIYGEFEAEMQVENGTLVLLEEETGDLTVESDGEGHLLLRGVLSQINAALAGLIYRPEAQWHGEDTLTVTAMDLINSETKTGEISIKVNSANDAPVLDNSAEIVLASVEINDTSPPETRVWDMTEHVLADADEDDEPGIAVVSADNSLGTWQYSVNDGTDWAAFDADISAGHALLLGPDDLIRFLPAGNQTGKVYLTFRGWDQSNGKTSGSIADTGENSGSSAFSQQIVSASVTVVNTPPGPGLSVQANAGADQEVSEGSTVTLNGSQSEIPQGSNLSIEWIQSSASLTVTIADVHSLTTSFAAPAVGTEGAELEFTLKLTDTDGNAWTDSVLIKVKDSTASPGESVKAEAGADQEVTEGTLVTLNGSGSSIPAGVTAVYKWEKISGPDVTLSSPNSVSSTFAAPDLEAGTQALLVFRLTVSDSAGNSSTDTVTVKVSGTGGAGQTLAAEAGADQEVTEGTLVTLSASGSFIPAGVTVAYKWEKISGLVNVTLSGSDSVSATFTAPDADSDAQTVLVFRLTITDSTGISSADTVTVKVNATASNQTPVAEAGANQEVAQGTVVMLNGSGSFIPAGVTPFYKWEKISGPDVSFSSPNSVSNTFVAPNVDSGAQSVLVFRLTVSDSAGNSSTDTVIVKVNGSGVTNRVPVAEAGTSQNVKKGDTVTLNGMWSYDPDGIIVAWQWKELSDAGVTLTAPGNVNTTFTAPSGGTGGKTLTFELTVTDNAGQQSKDTMTVYVAADTAVPGDDDDDDDDDKIPDTTVTEGGTVTLKGSQAGNFGSGASYSWKQISGTAVVLSNPNAADPTFVTPAVGAGGTNLVFELTVTEAGTQVYKGNVTVGIQDNGIVIVGAPEGILTFKPVTTVEMGISIGNSAKLIRLEPVNSASITDTRNRPESMIYGMIRMEIQTAAAGDTVPVTLYLNNAVPDGYRWYKYSEKNGWSDFSANTVISADRKQILLTLTDGGAGDSDGLANGMIIDPSGLGKPASGNSSESSGGGDGDGGSCFIRSAFSDLFHF